MSAYQANVKVKPPTKWVGLNAVFDRSQLHHIGQQGKRPPTPSLPAGGAFTSSRLGAAATGAAPWAAKRSEQRGGAGGHPLQAGPGRSAWPWYIGMERIKAKPTIIEMKIYQFG